MAKVVSEEQGATAGKEITAAKCRGQFAEIVDADDAFRSQQHALFDLLSSADAIWDRLLVSFEKGAADRKHGAAMRAVSEAIKENLKLQNNLLKGVEDKLPAVIDAIEQYRNSIARARGDHAHVQDAVDARLKAMAQTLRANKGSEAKKRSESGERRPRAPNSPSHSETKKNKHSKF
jgi:hypothetical protein